ncbi:ribbon-helix-helix domain-containing protein [Aeribacillus sp. FSL K6-1121]|uniref:ribbon-helix-helix domain-containing protein n=1 Tax=Aeribacillus sp. FSL K6-1121 TaxID=2954745 RepID=UPI0030FCC6A1
MGEFRTELIGKRFFKNGAIYTVYAVAATGLFAHEGTRMNVNERGEVINPKFFSYEDVEGTFIGPGRPAKGTTKKVSLTLTEDIWKEIQQIKKEKGISQSAVLRDIIEHYFIEQEVRQ